MVNGDEFWNNQVRTFERSKIINGTFPDRKAYLPHIQKKIRKIINKCLEIDVDKRYQSVLDIINDLSVIDGEMDWLYEKKAGIGEIWKNKVDNMEISITLKELGTAYEIETIKTNIQSKRQIRISAMCRKGLSKSEAYKMIQEYIK